MPPARGVKRKRDGDGDDDDSDAEGAPPPPTERNEEWWIEVQGVFDKTFLPDVFASREGQTETMHEVLQNDDVGGGCLFLYGPPGTGKTSLTNRVLADIKDAHAEGVVRTTALTCTSFKTPKLLMSAILEWLGLQGGAASVKTQWEWVVDYFRNGPAKRLGLPHRGHDLVDTMTSASPKPKKRKANDGQPVKAKPPVAADDITAEYSLRDLAALAKNEFHVKVGGNGRAKQPFLDAYMNVATASACYIVLDEVDAFFEAAPKKVKLNPKSKHNIAGAAGAGGPPIEANATREDVVCALLHLASSLGPTDKQLFVVCSSNEERMESKNRVIQMIPANRRVHFPAYTKPQFSAIVAERAAAVGRRLEDLFDKNALEGVLMKVGSVANGDCRKLLEYLRLSLGKKSQKADAVVKKALTVGDVASSLPYQNDLERWLLTLGQRECVLLVASLVMQAKTQPPLTVAELDKAFHKIHERFLGALPGGSETTLTTLGVVIHGAPSGWLMVHSSSGGGGSGVRRAGRAAAKNRIDSAAGRIDLLDHMTLGPSLRAVDVHSALHKCARTDAQKADDVVVLTEIIQHYFPQEDYMY